MIGLLDAIKIAAGAILGAALLSGPIYLYGKSAGRTEAATAALQKSLKAYKDRENENASIDTLDAVGLCISLGGVPDECRTELRRLAKDNAAPEHGSLSIRK